MLQHLDLEIKKFLLFPFFIEATDVASYGHSRFAIIISQIVSPGCRFLSSPIMTIAGHCINYCVSFKNQSTYPSQSINTRWFIK